MMNRSIGGIAAMALLSGISLSARGSTIGSLAGSVYVQGGEQSITKVDSNGPAGGTAATSYIAGTPTATFNSTLVNSGATYTANDGSNLNTFLSAIPADNASKSANPGPLGSFVMDLNGYITVDQTGSYTFGLNNDDGGAFYLNGNGTPGSGTVLVREDGDQGQPGLITGAPVTLTAGVPYRLEYIYYNQGCGGCGYTNNGTVDNSGGGADAFAQVTGPGNITFSATPEPAALGLLSIASVTALARRRRI